MGAEFRITTLGKLQITRSELPLDGFISTKAALLFVFLAMHPGDHARRKLATMLWSETNDEQALKNLRTVLSSVRQQVGDAVIVTHDSLAVDPTARIVTDAVQFESGCAHVFGQPAGSEALRTMQNLAALYQGDFLLGVSVRDAAPLENWIIEKQRHLQELYTRLLSALVESATQQGAAELALGYAQQLTNMEPLWDVAQRQLMRLLAYTNKAHEALLQYERFARLLAEELGTQPEAETTALYAQIRAQDFGSLPTKVAPTRIVLPDMPYVEPVADIAFAQRMLNTPQCRLLTVFGISGIGKTTLVTQIAYQRQERYNDGTYFIALKETRTARELPYLIAHALGLDSGGQADEAVVEQIVMDRIHNREMLLVLDNYEQLLPETRFVQRILEQTSKVQLILTSQSPLNLFREWLLPLRGLTVPSADDPQPESYEAVRLFELTAQRIDPRFDLAQNLVGVMRICQLVDGLPLAIIIAAGWTQIVPVDKIVEYLEAGQEFSLPLQRSLPGHHQSLERMLEYTWGTLSPQEQDALTALSAFNAGFNLDEAHAICDVDLEALTLLIQRALVQRFDNSYRMHQLVWRYARKKLRRSNQQAALAERYLKYFGEVLAALQAERPLLHDYLLALEALLAHLWNYDWMPRSFQPIFMLTLSRYLMVYWEISQPEILPTIHESLATLNPALLPADLALLHSIQLARLNLHIGADREALDSVELALMRADSAHWHDLGVIFNLYARLLPLAAPTSAAQPMDADAANARRTMLKLAAVYLAIRDTASTEELLAHLDSSDAQPLDRALIAAMRGSIAAENADPTAAGQHFSDALAFIEALDLPALKIALHHARQRVSSGTPVWC